MRNKQANNSPKKKRKIILGIILTLVLCYAGYLYFCVPMQFESHYPESLEPLSPETMLTKEQVEEDRIKAIQFVEDVHPYFVLVKDRNEYEIAKQKYVEATQTGMSVFKFQAATSEYLCSLADGHTHIWWDEEKYVLLDQTYQNGKTYLVENQEVTNKWITKMGEIPIEEIYKTIGSVIPAENDMAVMINRTNYIVGQNMLKLAGAKIHDSNITIEFSDGSLVDYPFYTLSNSPVQAYENLPNSCRMEEDIFVVDFNQCTYDDNLKAIAEKLEKEIQQGCTKVIIDARGNGGGDSLACTRLLKAMGMEEPNYSIFIRYSKEAKEQCGYLRAHGSYKNSPSVQNKTNDAIHLVVLCDKYTFSSATMLCVFVKDGRLGTLIGEPSSNMPSNYGDILYLSLPNSHLFASVSHKQFIRPNGDITTRMLLPDIQTEPEDAYSKALEYLK